MFYLAADRLTGGLIPKGVSDFRLVDRKVYEAVRSMQESNRFVRGLFAWVGLNLLVSAGHDQRGSGANLKQDCPQSCGLLNTASFRFRIFH